MTSVGNDALLRQGLGELLPRLRRFARSLARDPADADDLVQVALERALARSAQWDPARSLAGWIFGIVRHAWTDELRARQRRGQVLAPESHGEQVGTAPIAAEETRMAVQSALAALPEEQRMVVMLVLVEGLSYKEAAEALEVPVGTVTSRLARARQALQARLDPATEDGA